MDEEEEDGDLLEISDSPDKPDKIPDDGNQQGNQDVDKTSVAEKSTEIEVSTEVEIGTVYNTANNDQDFH